MALIADLGLSQNSRPALPSIASVFGFPLRDPAIDIGSDDMYYLTGTTGWPNWWKTNKGIRIRKSQDLKNSTPLGLVCRLHSDAECELPGDPEKRKVYDCMAASSEKTYGPYTDWYLAVPDGGHNMVFRDRQNQWWPKFFGNDPIRPFRERFGQVRIEFGPDGHFRPTEGRP